MIRDSFYDNYLILLLAACYVDLIRICYNLQLNPPFLIQGANPRQEFPAKARSVKNLVKINKWCN